MNSKEIREKFLKYFEELDHARVQSSLLVASDPSVLFTTAGMQQFKEYFTGKLNSEKDFGGLNVTSVQKCFRTSDIDEVGDKNHLTFLEMLGNFSFGGYFKEKAIEYAYRFITEEMGLEIDYVTVFDPEKVEEGDWRKDVPFDKDSFEIWRDKIGLPEGKIKGEGVDNFWGPTGSEGPCGPTTEIYVKGMEVWNIVFNEYYRKKDNALEKLEAPGVDTGMGLERLTMMAQEKPTIFETDLFLDIMPPKGFPSSMSPEVQRIVLDHARAVAFLVSDGIRPSNKEQGYMLRRLIRRAMAHFSRASQSSFSGDDILGQDFLDIENLLSRVVEKYKEIYDELEKETILSVFREEKENFLNSIRKGLKELKKVETLDAKTAFKLYESFGLSYEIIKDFAGDKAKNLSREEFDKEFEKHKEVSRAGVEKKFGGHGLELDTGELKAGTDEEMKKVVRLHTATHLLHQALHDVIGETRQEGSDINPERARFDFQLDRKLTDEELRKVEDIVNEKIEENLSVNKVEMPKEEALKTGARHYFKIKYPETVSVYYIGSSLEKAYSKEFCGGPHVKSTGEIEEFKILKHKSVARDVKRIRATVE